MGEPVTILAPSRIGRTFHVEIPHRLPGMMGPRRCFHPDGHDVLISIEFEDDPCDGWDGEAELDKAIRHWRRWDLHQGDFADLAADTADTADTDLHDSELPDLAGRLYDLVGSFLPFVRDQLSVWVWRRTAAAQEAGRFQPRCYPAEAGAGGASAFPLFGLRQQTLDLVRASRDRVGREHGEAVAEQARQRDAIATWRAGGGPVVWLGALDLAAAALEHQLGDVYGLFGVYFEQPELAVAALALTLYLEAAELGSSPSEVAVEALMARFFPAGRYIEDLEGWEVRLAAVGHDLADGADPVVGLWHRLSAPRYPQYDPEGRHRVLPFALGPVMKDCVRHRLWPTGLVTATEPLHPWTV